MEIIFLGTSGSMPTSIRSLPSVVIRREGRVFMFDCGEGTQRQLATAKIGFNREMAVLISHMHGDHVLGLPGMIQSMALLGRSKPLKVFGPKGLKGYLKAIDTYVPYASNFDVNVCEVRDGVVVDDPEFRIEAVWVDHSGPCLAYSFTEKPRPGKFNPKAAARVKVPEGPLWRELQMGRAVTVGGRVVKPEKIVGPPRPGKKIVYSGDTKPCPSILRLSKGADVVIFDSTFDESRTDKAKSYGHSTSKQAAVIARKAGVKKLYLTHVSAIYNEEAINDLLKQARKIFPRTYLATDLLRIEV